MRYSLLITILIAVKSSTFDECVGIIAGMHNLGEYKDTDRAKWMTAMWDFTLNRCPYTEVVDKFVPMLAQAHSVPIQTIEDAQSVMSQIQDLSAQFGSFKATVFKAAYSQMLLEWMTEERCLEYQAEVDFYNSMGWGHGKGLNNIIRHACPCPPETLSKIEKINSSSRLRVQLDEWTEIDDFLGSKCKEFAITISSRALYKPISNAVDYESVRRQKPGCSASVRELHWAEIGRCRALSRMSGEWEASHSSAHVLMEPPGAARAPIPIHAAGTSIESRGSLQSERTKLGTTAVSLEATQTFPSTDENNLFIERVMRLIVPVKGGDPKQSPPVSIYEVTRKFNQLIDPYSSGETLTELLAADKSYWLKYGILWLMNSRLSDDSPNLPSWNLRGLCASFDSLGFASKFEGCKEILEDPFGGLV